MLSAAPVVGHTLRLTSSPTYVLLRSTRQTFNPAVTGSYSGITPAQMQHAYGIDQVKFSGITGDGTGQTIAIVDAYNAPTIASDLATFDSTFNLAPPPSFIHINQSGGSTMPTSDSGWSVESSLDVEWAHALAPKATIVLISANSASDSDLLAAIDTARNYPGVSVVSMSWGGDEWSTESSYDSHFTTPTGHTPVTFVASSGDSGAYSTGSTAKIPEWPAVSPKVVGVGGTHLNLADSLGTYLSETGWGNGTSSQSSGGSGGGISSYYSQPTWQKGVVTQSTTKRTVPDVSMDADPYSGVPVLDTFASSSWQQVGGTSLAAPMFGAVLTIANQGRALAGKATLDGSADTLPKLYALAAGDFHDITSGNNGYAAGTGYDLVTGRGSPIVNSLASDLVGAPATPTPAIGSFTIAPSSAPVSSTVITLTASNVQELNGTGAVSQVAFYRESNGTAGFQSTDAIIGIVTASQASGTTYALQTSTMNMTPGTYTYYAVATDSANVNSAVSSATFTVVVPTIGSFAVSPSSVSAGTSVNLVASSVQETNGSIKSVTFYRETNGTSGLQTGTDTTLGTLTQATSGQWSLATSTTGFAAGTYTYYAVATDAAGVTSAVSSATLTITAPVQRPANDMFASATGISGALISVKGTNVNATKESGEPNHALNAGGKSVWWSWTAPTSGNVNVNTHGSNFDTLLGVYTGTAVNALTTIASNDDDPGYGLTSGVTFKAVQGVTYSIAVDGYNAKSGNISLNLSETAAPASDLFANAVALPTPGPVSWTGSTVGATREPGEPYHAYNSGGASIWFTWTADSTRSVSINTHGSNFDTLLAVYTGNAVNTLTAVASNDDDSGYGLTSGVTLNAVQGTVYHIAVDGYNGATGSVVLNVV